MVPCHGSLVCFLTAAAAAAGQLTLKGAMQVLLRNARAAAAGRRAAEADSSEHSGSGLDGEWRSTSSSSSTSSSTNSSAGNTDSAAKEGACDAVDASLMTKENSGGMHVSIQQAVLSLTVMCCCLHTGWLKPACVCISCVLPRCVDASEFLKHSAPTPQHATRILTAAACYVPYSEPNMCCRQGRQLQGAAHAQLY